MALTNGKGGVGYRIYGDNSDYKASINDARNYAEKQAESIGKAFKAAFVAAGAAVTSAITLGVKYNANIEQYTKTFEGLLQSEEKAGQLMKELSTYAQETSFDIDGLASSAKTMLAYGVEDSKIIDTIKMLGDISMGSTENMNRLALAFGQMQAKGKVVTQDLRQMQEVGFNPLEYISRKTGESMAALTERLEKGGVSVSEVASAMKLATSEGEKFYNMTSLQADTLQGKWNELKEKAQEAFGKMTSEVNGALRSAMEAAIKFIEKIDFKKVKQSVESFLTTLKKLLPAITSALAVWLKFKVALGVQGVLSKVTTGIKTLTKVVSGGGLIGAIKSAVTAVKGLWAALSANPIGLVVGGFTALIAAIGGAMLATDKCTESQRALIDRSKEAKEAAEESAEAFNELKSAQGEIITQGTSEVNYMERLNNELKTMVDENGRVKEGYEGRAAFILGQLNDALGTEYTMNGNIIQSYKDMQAEIDTLLEKKRAQLILEGLEPVYKQAVLNIDASRRKNAQDILALNANLAMQEHTLQEIEDLRAKKLDLLKQGYSQLSPEIQAINGKVLDLAGNYVVLTEAEGNLRDAVDDSTATVNSNQEAIWQYETLFEMMQTEPGKVVEEWGKMSTGTSEALSATEQSTQDYVSNLKTELDIAKTDVEQYGQRLKEGLPGYTEQGLNDAIKKMQDKEAEWKAAGGNIPTGVAQGIQDYTWKVTEAAKQMALDALSNFKFFNWIQSPSKRYKKEARNIPLGVAEGIEDTDAPEQAVKSMSEKMVKQFQIEGKLSQQIAMTNDVASVVGMPQLHNEIVLRGDVEMDGFKVGRVVLKNIDDAAAFSLRGNI